VNSLALSVKQEKFCLEYAKSGNQRQAYLLAGYNCKSDEAADANASRLLRNDKVQARLAELAEEAKNASIADIVEMQQTLTSIIRKQMTEEVIVVESVGDYMTEARKMDKEPSIKDIINAITTLGKMQGAFVEKVQQEVDMDLNIVVDYGDAE
jgi:phage terminase small subunit